MPDQRRQAHDPQALLHFLLDPVTPPPLPLSAQAEDEAYREVEASPVPQALQYVVGEVLLVLMDMLPRLLVLP